MNRQFKVRVVPSKWIEGTGHRLDCGPYVSGARELREQIATLHVPKNELQDLTGGISGIVNAGRIPRLWVQDNEHGYPFLSSTDIQQSDISNLSFISKKTIQSNPQLLIHDKWTLITRAGTVGRTVYARTDMDGLACTEDVLRVMPDENKVLPGYVYAFLNTRYGIPMVVSGTYGSIITHLEPSHLADLPVPRLGAVEQQAHDLVQRAADLRVEANRLLKDATTDLELEIGGGPVDWKHRHVQSFAVETRTVSNLFARLDAFHYVGYVGEAIEKAAVPLVEVGTYAKSLRPPIMKRNRVEESGYEFLGGSELVTLEQRSETKISERTPSIEQFIVHPGYVLFQCVGQRYGLFGRPVLASRAIIGKTVTEAVMRLIPNDPHDAGYITVYLATEFGQRLVMRHSAGTSIPVLQEGGAEKILIYWPDADRRHSISNIAEKAWENRALATELEDQARALVEHAIEEGGQ